ncbi:hypothetical protein [Stenotrophomonas phage BUCT555]|nr:hypothetical protein [Stenotrophomonas phage BUCT555]
MLTAADHQALTEARAYLRTLPPVSKNIKLGMRVDVVPKSVVVSGESVEVEGQWEYFVAIETVHTCHSWARGDTLTLVIKECLLGL